MNVHKTSSHILVRISYSQLLNYAHALSSLFYVRSPTIAHINNFVVLFVQVCVRIIAMHTPLSKYKNTKNRPTNREVHSFEK